eukprot:TRINITY_DN47800_c0_g1_i1.p1 TRINITY_DN47800_c0_g1~~TRINITY_DN47800_c0_g1_i1.p1  ORF type:complete len:298 (+),score=63.51 TRINITY_DN47800_c0_g1_i1:52-945(+)
MPDRLAATQPPPLDALPEAAERAWGRHPAGQQLGSGLSGKLHPANVAVGCQPDHDPTFLGIGWGHKRRLAPQPPQYLPDRPGKKTYDLPDAFKKADFIRQDLAQPYGPQMGPTRLIRARRREEKISQDAERRKWEGERQQLNQAGQDKRREKLTELGARAGCNPLTGGKPICGQEVVFAEGKPKLRPRHHIEHQQARPGQGVSPATAAARAERRRDRLANDGIDPSRRNWSVSRQMHCYDGFDCPPEVLQGLTFDVPRPGRRIFTHQVAASDGGAAGAIAPHMVPKPASDTPAAESG